MIQPLTDAELRGYLARIGHAGARQPDLATLTALQRAHIAAIPFETTAMMLGDPPTLDPDRAYHRLVTNRLGGCCYEMNGLFGRVLATIGFVVTRLGPVSGATCAAMGSSDRTSASRSAWSGIIWLTSASLAA